jgi:hypothetical protein
MYERILEDANRSFASLSDTNKWGPDVTNKDKQGAPESYHTESKANTMVQKAITKAKEDIRGGGGQEKDNECFKCGKKGHRRADCKIGSKEVASWKTKPPSSGQPESKHVDGKELDVLVVLTCFSFSHSPHIVYLYLPAIQMRTRTAVLLTKDVRDEGEDIGDDGDDADNDGDIVIDTDKEEADVADAPAEGDMTSGVKAKEALQKRHHREKKMVVLQTRKGKRITSIVWQGGYFAQASLLDGTKNTSNFCVLFFPSPVLSTLLTLVSSSD